MSDTWMVTVDGRAPVTCRVRVHDEREREFTSEGLQLGAVRDAVLGARANLHRQPGSRRRRRLHNYIPFIHTHDTLFARDCFGHRVPGT